MTKKEKILTSLVVLSFALALFLIVTSKPKDNFAPTSDGGNSSGRAQPVDLQKMEEEYKKEAKDILIGYLRESESADLNIDEVKRAKNEFLSLKVPAEFKDLHLKLVLAMVKMENFFLSGTNEEKAASRELIGQIKANYSWIN